jgi:hypothetical protein
MLQRQGIFMFSSEICRYAWGGSVYHTVFELFTFIIDAAFIFLR